MFEAFLPSIILGTVANQIDRRLVDPALAKIRGDPTVAKALRDAWRSAVDEVFSAYMVSHNYEHLSDDEKSLVNERQKWLKEDNVFERIMRGPSAADDNAFTVDDPTAIFLIGENQTGQILVSTLDRLGILDGLPVGLLQVLQHDYVSQLRAQIIQKVFLDNEAVRDSVIFQQFASIRREIGNSGEMIETAWREMGSQIDAYIREHSKDSSTIRAQLDRIEDKLDKRQEPDSVFSPTSSSIGQFAVLTYGLANLPGAILTKVESFLAEYLGLPEARVPFGGRSNEIAALDAWLADPDKPCALLVAPTGRGKSAVVTQWAFEVAARGGAQVALLPVSVRFDTARRDVAYALLGARLRHILTSASGAMPHIDSSVWLTEIDTYLRDGRPQDQPLLIVIDGVDEAIDWMLGRDLAFPKVMAPGLKVLVTARPLPDDTEDAWRGRLNFMRDDVQQLTLPVLGRAAVRQIVFDSGGQGANPADEELFASEVYRLTDGDPILVRLYVDLRTDRANAGSPLTIDELQTLEPGLAGYFAREWEGLVRQWGANDPLAEPVTHALLHVLTCARGPMSRADLVALTKNEGASSIRVDKAIKSLKRLVVGAVATGYSFSHQRFAQFFREERFTAEELRVWEARLTDYGRDVVTRLEAGDLDPANVPRYVLAHHASQLGDIGANPSELFALITKPWLLAWESSSGTSSGFLNDLQHAWRAAEEFGSSAIAHCSHRTKDLDSALTIQVRAALLASSIRSSVGSVPLELVKQLVAGGRWTPLQAIAYAGAMPSDRQRKAALCALAELGLALPELSFLEAAQSIGDTRTRVEVLACVVTHLNGEMAHQVVTETLSLVLEIGDLSDRAAALLALVPVLSHSHMDQARSFGESLHTAYDRVRVFAALATRQRGSAKVRLAKDALTETAQCDGGLRVLALDAVSSALTASTLSEAIALADDIDAPLHRANAFFVLLPLIHRKSRDNMIARIAEELESVDPDDRIDLRIAMLAWTDETEFPRKLGLLKQDVLDATTPGARLRAITVLAQVAVANGQVDEALALLDRSIDHPVTKAGVLIDLARAALPRDLPRLLEVCQSAITAINIPGREALYLADLAALAPEPLTHSLALGAMAAARREPAGVSRAMHLTLAAAALPLNERGTVLDEALATARGLGDEWHLNSTVALTEILKVADTVEQPIVFDLVTSMLPRISGMVDRAYASSLLLPYAHDAALRSRLADEALEGLIDATTEAFTTESGEPIQNMIRIGNWERQRADIVLALAPFLDERQLDKALNFARSVGDPSAGVEMLVGIGQQLKPEDRASVMEEALALVAQIEAEASRADLYGVFFGTLDPGIRGKILTAIADINDPQARALGCISLLKHASAFPQPEVVTLAREAIVQIRRPQDQYSLSMYLAWLVPEDARASIYRQAAAAAAAMPEHWERMVRLSDVAVYLKGDARTTCVTYAVQAARSQQPINGRWQALAFLVCRLMELGLADLATELALEIEDEHLQARANVCVAARSAEQFQIEEALRISEAIGNPGTRAELLLTVAEHSPPGRRRECLEKALSAILAIPKDRDRTPLLNLTLPLLVGLSDTEHYAIWSGILRTMGGVDRGRMLTDLMTLLPMLRRVNGRSTLVAFAEAIADTDEWFLQPHS